MWTPYVMEITYQQAIEFLHEHGYRALVLPLGVAIFDPGRELDGVTDKALSLGPTVEEAVFRLANGN